ncbi:MAG: hypothetical protein ACI8XV_002169 [Arenicella sp.]|jgi:hypothetical protein
MSKENLIILMKRAVSDEQLRQQLQNANSYEEIKKLACEVDLELCDLSEEEARRTVQEASIIEDADGELFEAPPALL